MTRADAFERWRDCHRGETMVVCGCGTSLAALTEKPPCPTIGVNDVGRLFDPDYLLVVNPENQFSPDRYRAIRDSGAAAVFTSVPDLSVARAEVVRFRLGRRGGTAVTESRRLPYTRNSPYVALALARVMGAARIGLIGVDFTPDHFWGTTGRHPLARELAQMNREYGRFAQAAEADGVEIVNLSPRSLITALPRAPLEPFLASLRRDDQTCNSFRCSDMVSASLR